MLILDHMKTRLIFILLLSSLSFSTCAQSTAPQLSKIQQEELKTQLYELAGDDFRGRRGGELAEMRASVWVAQKAMEAGLQPAGESLPEISIVRLMLQPCSSSMTRASFLSKKGETT